MKKVDLKEHNQKYVELSKRAASGEYPSKRGAKVGSIIGGAIGIILLIVGVIGSFGGFIWGIGSLIGGLVTIVSSILNLKRMK